MLILDALHLMARDLATPSAFRRNWYAWVTNQMSHITLGIMLTTAVSAGLYLALGEFAAKGWIFGVVATVYMLIEFAGQKGGTVADRIEDMVFVLAYGAGSCILLFDAAEGPAMQADILEIAPICAIVGAHLVAGSLSRAIREVRRGTKLD